MDTETNQSLSSPIPQKRGRHPESEYSTAAINHHSEFVEPEPAKRRRTFIQRQKRLQLQIAVKMGLSKNAAGKLFGVGSASRVVRQTQQLLATEQDQLVGILDEERAVYEAQLASEVDEATLEVLMVVTKAREQGVLDKKNLNKLNAKINEKIEHLIDNQMQSKVTLQECLNRNSGGTRKLRKLPFPSSKIFRQAAGHLGEVSMLSESERQAHLAPDLKQDDRVRLHAFLFGKSALPSQTDSLPSLGLGEVGPNIDHPSHV